MMGGRDQRCSLVSLLPMVKRDAYRDVQIIIDLDDLAEDADPLIQVGEIERVPQLVYQRLLFGLLGVRAVGLVMRPLSRWHRGEEGMVACAGSENAFTVGEGKR